jgi:hypothetical protein
MKPPSPQHPDAVLSDLKSKLKPRAHRNLENVQRVCREIHAGTGRKDYSLAAVGRALEHRKESPNYNTLKAPGGAHFKALITAWATWDGVGMSKPPRSAAPDNGFSELLKKITDPALRSELGFLLAEGRRHKAQLDALKGMTSLTIDMRPKDGLPQAQSDVPALAPPTPAVLMDTEREALRRAVDEKRLKQKGLSIGPDGEILQNQKLLFDVGFASGLRKLLEKI